MPKGLYMIKNLRPNTTPKLVVRLTDTPFYTPETKLDWSVWVGGSLKFSWNILVKYAYNNWQYPSASIQ